ncbi:SsrA-binding protein SmpB [Salinibius halmophilus]|uniref:SsrA-binding protein SmpB n=1 Tax=Salinibius halmophilus TaxID=1853216 RepID=UPI000E65EDD4|nr:SsrA-binding protein SmpB [Salinibius halmophilus]
MAKKKKLSPGNIAQNRRATFDFAIDERIEAGLSLQGWEVKSLRQGKVQLHDAYVIFQNGEAYLVGCEVTPLNTASTHVICEPGRAKKLLMHGRELDRCERAANQDGYTVVALNLHWKGPYIKCEIGIGKGKKAHDKRETMKDRDWKKQKSRIMKHSAR